MASSQIINLDIGGVKFRSSYSTLTSEPNSILAARVERWTEDKEQEMFIDRDACHFRYILNYLRDGDTAIVPDGVMVLRELKREAQFYKLPGLVQLLDRQVNMLNGLTIFPLLDMYAVGGCRQVQQGSGSVGGNVVESVEEAASSAGLNQPGPSQTKQLQNGEILVPKAETEMPICTNSECVLKGKCGVLQLSDQHMTHVWMCPECYCTIALPQQQTAAVVDGGGTVSKKSDQQKKVIAPVKINPVVKMSGRRKSTVHTSTVTGGRPGQAPAHAHTHSGVNRKPGARSLLLYRSLQQMPTCVDSGHTVSIQRETHKDRKVYYKWRCQTKGCRRKLLAYSCKEDYEKWIELGCKGRKNDVKKKILSSLAAGTESVFGYRPLEQMPTTPCCGRLASIWPKKSVLRNGGTNVYYHWWCSNGACQKRLGPSTKADYKRYTKLGFRNKPDDIKMEMLAALKAETRDAGMDLQTVEPPQDGVQDEHMHTETADEAYRQFIEKLKI